MALGSAGRVHRWITRVVGGAILLAATFGGLGTGARAGSEARAGGAPAVLPGLDSLTTQTLWRALDYLEIQPAELGFDKLYATDDTFRLPIVTELLDDPLRLPGRQAALVAAVRDCYRDPSRLAGELAGLADAPDPGEHPATAWLPCAEAPSPATGGGVDEAIARFTERCRAAEAELEQAFAAFSATQRDSLLLLAPCFWGEPEEDPLDGAKQGRLHFEFGAPADTSGEWEIDPILDMAARLDRPALTRATHIFAEAVAGLTAAIDRLHAAGRLAGGTGRAEQTEAGVRAERPAGVIGTILASRETPWGELVIGGTQNNTYSEEALERIAFLFDLGGDDTYRGRAGCAIGTLLRPLGALVDWAGDDLFTTGGRDYALGAGLLGVAILVDGGGDDIYRGGDGCQGAGFFGAGLLYDAAGRDVFTGGSFCQGAGACGLGALIADAIGPAPPGPELDEDRAFAAGLVKAPGTGAVPVRHDENDLYTCARESQGFGSTFGVGLLYDAAGNDTYRAGGRYRHAPLLANDFQSLAQGFAIGFRPRAAGGIGLLLDEQGNDVYSAAVYAQGVSYWYSLGLLFDGAGNDRYLATQYAQGAGVHLAVGSLWDVGGDDHYVSHFGVTQGTAHDLSAGLLLDEGGDDYYVVSDGQGMSITNSASLFLDLQGDDFYATPRGGQGRLTWARGFCGAAIFLDLEGRDTYAAENAARDGAIWSADLHAIGIDLDRDVELPGEVMAEIVLTAEDSLRSVAELFETASLWEVGSAREKVRRARRAMIAKGISALDYVVAEQLGTTGALEYRAIRELAQAYPDSFAARILGRLHDPDEVVQRNVIGLLGDLHWPAGRAPLTAMLAERDQERHWTRIIHALGRIGDSEAAPALRPFLVDGMERRRITTIAALASLADTAAVPAIAARLGDAMLTVRAAAVAALRRFGTAAIDPVCERVTAGSEPAALGVRLLGDLAVALRDSSDALSCRARARARALLMEQFPTPPSEAPAAVRAAAVSGLLRLGDPETEAYVRARMLDEYDPLVRRTYEHLLEEGER